MTRFYLYDMKINNKDFIFTFDKETYRLGIYYDKNKFSTPKVKPLMYIVRKIKFFRKNTLPEGLDYIKIMCTLRPMYAQINSTDCDHYHTETVRKYSCGYKFYKSMIEFYDNVEYKGAFYSITKEQYEERKDKDVSRDYVAEAHENGHPYNVRG